MLLAVASHQREQTPETLGALQVALSSYAPVLAVLGGGGDYIDVEWLSNGLIVGIRPDGLDLFDPDSAKLLDSVALQIGRVSHADDLCAEPITRWFRRECGRFRCLGQRSATDARRSSFPSGDIFGDSTER